VLSKPTNCYIENGICVSHRTRHMLQFFSLKLSKIPLGCGPIELYGYMAAWDNLDPLLNYIVNFSRDHPIIIEHPSLCTTILVPLFIPHCIWPIESHEKTR
jgi:hypothetical protein